MEEEVGTIVVGQVALVRMQEVDRVKLTVGVEMHTTGEVQEEGIIAIEVETLAEVAQTQAMDSNSSICLRRMCPAFPAAPT